jgi:hypothetical protein
MTVSLFPKIRYSISTANASLRALSGGASYFDDLVANAPDGSNFVVVVGRGLPVWEHPRIIVDRQTQAERNAESATHDIAGNYSRIEETERVSDGQFLVKKTWRPASSLAVRRVRIPPSPPFIIINQ